jgi:hypothetical protein
LYCNTKQQDLFILGACVAHHLHQLGGVALGPVLGEVGAEHGLGGGAVTACQGRGKQGGRENSTLKMVILYTIYKL